MHGGAYFRNFTVFFFILAVSGTGKSKNVYFY